MRKIIALLICILFTIPAVNADWTQIKNGVYVDNMQVKGKTIKISYLYNRNSPEFVQELQKYKGLNLSSISAYSVDVFIDCNSGRYKLSNAKMYGTNNSLIYSDNNEHWYNENPQVMGMCYSIQQ